MTVRKILESEAEYITTRDRIRNRLFFSFCFNGNIGVKVAYDYPAEVE